MMNRDEVTNVVQEIFGQELLAKAAKVDQLPNSLQIRGKDKIKKIVLGVSANLEFLELAKEAEGDYLIVHHGLYLSSIANSRLDPFTNRLRLILGNDVNLAGFHYALDAHPEIGNNAQIIEALGAKRLDIPFFDEWGWVGEFHEDQSVKTLAKKCAQIFEHDIYSVFAGPEKVKRIGVCSGGAKPYSANINEMVDKQIDVFISGEITESGPYVMEEIGVNYFSTGHYASETFGIKALGKKLKDQLGEKVAIEFIDVPTNL